MGKAKRERALALQKQRRRRILTVVITAAVIAVVIAVTAAASIMVNRKNTAYKNLSIPLSVDGSLHISASELSSGLNYVDWGGAEELILYRSGDNIAAAFDTCEECYTRGSVHFTRDGDIMQCSVCGTTTPVSGLGAQSWGGCQPLAIPSSARLDTDDEVVLSAEVMTYASDMLALWDNGDLNATLERFGQGTAEEVSAQVEAEIEAADLEIIGADETDGKEQIDPDSLLVNAEDTADITEDLPE